MTGGEPTRGTASPKAEGGEPKAAELSTWSGTQAVRLQRTGETAVLCEAGGVRCGANPLGTGTACPTVGETFNAKDMSERRAGGRHPKCTLVES